MAGVMDENVVERRALHRKRGDRSVGDARRLEQCDRGARAVVRRDPEYIFLRFHVGHVGQVPDGFRPVSRRAREADFEDVLAGNRGLQLKRGIERDEFPVINDRDAVAQFVGLVHVMGGDKNRQIALGFQPLEHFPNAHSRDGIEACRRLVEEENLRFVDEPAGDFEPAPHAAGKHFNRFIGPLFEVHRLEKSLDGSLPFFTRNAVKLGEDAHIFDGAQVEVGGHRLRNDADRAAHVVLRAHNVEAVDASRAGSGRHERGQHPDERGFSRAVWAQQAENFAVLDGEIEPVDGNEIAEAFGQVLNFDVEHGRGVFIRGVTRICADFQWGGSTAVFHSCVHL